MNFYLCSFRRLQNIDKQYLDLVEDENLQLL